MEVMRHGAAVPVVLSIAVVTSGAAMLSLIFGATTKALPARARVSSRLDRRQCGRLRWSILAVATCLASAASAARGHDRAAVTGLEPVVSESHPAALGWTNGTVFDRESCLEAGQHLVLRFAGGRVKVRRFTTFGRGKRGRLLVEVSQDGKRFEKLTGISWRREFGRVTVRRPQKARYLRLSPKKKRVCLTELRAY